MLHEEAAYTAAQGAEVAGGREYGYDCCRRHPEDPKDLSVELHALGGGQGLPLQLEQLQEGWVGVGVGVVLGR